MTAKTTIPPGKWTSQIPDFARRIGEAAHARRVILFGSAARGDMGKHSDLDFLVVIPDVRQRRDAWTRANRAACKLYRLDDSPPAMDIVVVSEDAVREQRDCFFSVVKWAMDEGQEVWRADDVRQT